MAVQHVVLFRFEPPLSEEERAGMRAKVAAWPAAIGGFRRLRLGGDDLNGGERARGYEVLLLTEHDDEARLRAYQKHPVHQEFGAWVRERRGTVVAIDFELTDATVLLAE